ncbi:MAG TPA: R3H domain-containing nucleic acid-binding protein [Anaerolineaceae bacterium]|nr:R3H domain-containing nucleic acid-binding protein [Anaerolineaceae bacterium]
MTTTQKKITDDLDAMLSVLPPDIARAVQSRDNFDNLLEVILDLGRLPTARFVDEEVPLSTQNVTQADIDYVTTRIGDFDADNRAGMERTLHRISAIRNRRGKIVGLTCRVGRAVYGTIDIIADLVNSGQSILILGKPGVGKTTMLREAARILAETRRVVIVDTSNEIGGDGDVPHPAVGAARRMQVPKPSLQHEVMIEAVENHNPEVIVIDEIGRELEAQAARTIAERGVQLIGTAHGNSLENLLLNPTLSDLVGGIESVTLSDEEARRRGTQKTVLERRAPPTFTVLVEIQSRQRLAVHRDVSASVDAQLRGYLAPPEERYWDEKGGIHIQSAPQPAVPTVSQALKRGSIEKAPFQRGLNQDRTRVNPAPVIPPNAVYESAPSTKAPEMKNIFAFGIARNRLLQRIRGMGVPARLVRTLEEADTFVTQRRYYRERLQPIVQAEEQGLPIYVIKSNSDSQIEQFLADVFMVAVPNHVSSPYIEALEEADDAVQMVMNGEKYVDLKPAPADVRREQHQLAEKAELASESFGTEPRRFVRIFRD